MNYALFNISMKWNDISLYEIQRNVSELNFTVIQVNLLTTWELNTNNKYSIKMT